MSDNVRVRFAPSPTGALHIGGVRTALYNYLFARKMGGKLVLRIEDTDSQRFVPGAEEYIIESLKWLGINFDEGVGYGGNYGPYRQSERRSIYKEYVKVLLDKGKAYIAFDTPEELDEKRKQINNFQYDASTRMSMRNSLTMSSDEVENLINAGTQYVVRFKIEPNEEILVDDIIRGSITFDSTLLDDKVIYKSADELPTYHLANIVDDHLMKITHVIRGEEWLPSSPLHVLLYRAFGWEDTMPRFAHLSLLLKPEGNGKLSKRDGDRLGFPVFPLHWVDPFTKAESSGYRESGYLPEAVINFVGLLGWNPGNAHNEIMSMEEMIDCFQLDKCSKSGARFDYEKGLWFNHHYIMSEDNATLAKIFIEKLKENGLENIDTDYVSKCISLTKDRVNLMTEFWNNTYFFFKAPDKYDEKTVRKRWTDIMPSLMKKLIDVLVDIDDFSESNTEHIVKNWIAENNLNMGGIMNCLRLCLVGEPKGPSLFVISEMIGKEETIKRIESAIEKLS